MALLKFQFGDNPFSIFGPPTSHLNHLHVTIPSQIPCGFYTVLCNVDDFIFQNTSFILKITEEQGWSKSSVLSRISSLVTWWFYGNKTFWLTLLFIDFYNKRCIFENDIINVSKHYVWFEVYLFIDKEIFKNSYNFVTCFFLFIFCRRTVLTWADT